jgi:FkbM family methyltransferase
MKRRIVNYILSKISRHYGELKYQKIFQKFYEIGIYGMNYGNGAEFNISGEMDAIKYVQNKIKHGPDFILFDVGANVGNYSKSVASLFKERNITIHLFEPSKEVFKQLTLEIAGMRNVFPNNRGLGEKSLTLKLFKSKQSSGLSSLYKRKLDHFNIQMEETEEIEITSLDEYCRLNSIDRIDYLKIDVEGHELGVLKGATAMLNEKRIQFIQFEFGGTHIDSRNYFQDFYYFLKDNYDIYRIVKDGLVKIEGYREEQEIFLGINYLAELK